ncbi:hypothetical protein [Chitinophaga solisilvae]|uniref:hypothetical protein n=1 Tax=Chitinophaga solisilvae TaxID=1233460 RepID=UPI00136A42D5|nr:hypothetical protein [Chitinophaga solisilvae]
MKSSDKNLQDHKRGLCKYEPPLFCFGKTEKNFQCNNSILDIKQNEASMEYFHQKKTTLPGYYINHNYFVDSVQIKPALSQFIKLEKWFSRLYGHESSCSIESRYSNRDFILPAGSFQRFTKITRELNEIDIFVDNIVVLEAKLNRQLSNLPFQTAKKLITSVPSDYFWIAGITDIVNILTADKNKRQSGIIAGQKIKLRKADILDTVPAILAGFSVNTPPLPPPPPPLPLLSSFRLWENFEYEAAVTDTAEQSALVIQLLTEALQAVKTVRKKAVVTRRSLHRRLRSQLRLDLRSLIRTILKPVRISTYDGKDADHVFPYHSFSGKTFFKTFQKTRTCQILKYQQLTSINPYYKAA